MVSQSADGFVEQLKDDEVVEDREELDAILTERYGVSYDDVIDLDDLLREYQSEIEELNETYAERAEKMGFSEQFDLEADPLPFESLLVQLETAFASPIPTHASGDPVERLRELKDLRDEDVITREEYDVAKSRLLGRL